VRRTRTRREIKSARNSRDPVVFLSKSVLELLIVHNFVPSVRRNAHVHDGGESEWNSVMPISFTYIDLRIQISDTCQGLHALRLSFTRIFSRLYNSRAHCCNVGLFSCTIDAYKSSVNYSKKIRLRIVITFFASRFRLRRKRRSPLSIVGSIMFLN